MKYNVNFNVEVVVVLEKHQLVFEIESNKDKDAIYQQIDDLFKDVKLRCIDDIEMNMEKLKKCHLISNDDLSSDTDSIDFYYYVERV